jgi:hypothetical protein
MVVVVVVSTAGSLVQCDSNFVPLYLDGSGRVEREGNRIVMRESVLSRYASRLLFYADYSLFRYCSEVDRGERSSSSAVIPRLVPHREYAPHDPEQHRLYCRDMLIAFKPWHGDPMSLLPEGSTWEAELTSFLDSGRAPPHLLRERERDTAAARYLAPDRGGEDGGGEGGSPQAGSETESSESEFDLLVAASQLSSQESHLARRQSAADWVQAVAPTFGLGDSDGSTGMDGDLLDALYYGDDEYPWDAYARANPDYGQLRTFENGLFSRAEQLPTAAPRHCPLVLQGEQRLVFALVHEHFQRARNGLSQQDPLLLVISGTAGTGKSKVIQLLREQLGGACRVVAPSGVAAFNVSGVTIHSLLKIPINLRASETLEPLTGEALREAQASLQGVKYLIVDERSFIGQRLFALMSARLSQILPSLGASGALAPFGGLSVLLFGDDAQLPPVRDTPLYADPRRSDWASMAGHALYKHFRLCVVLGTVFRQAKGAFRSCLMRIREGAASDEDVRLLRSRVRNPDALPQFDDAPRLFATKAMVSACNLSRLARQPEAHQESQPAVARIPATDTGLTAAAFPDDEPPRHLLLKDGARVMLRRNLSVEYGLVNGALGQVFAIVYEPGRRPPQDVPFAVLVQFDQYTGPSCAAGIARVVPIFRVRTLGPAGGARTQFPLTLAWGMIVHKYDCSHTPRVPLQQVSAVSLGDVFATQITGIDITSSGCRYRATRVRARACFCCPLEGPNDRWTCARPRHQPGKAPRCRIPSRATGGGSTPRCAGCANGYGVRTSPG